MNEGKKYTWINSAWWEYFADRLGTNKDLARINSTNRKILAIKLGVQKVESVSFSETELNDIARERAEPIRPKLEKYIGVVPTGKHLWQYGVPYLLSGKLTEDHIIEVAQSHSDFLDERLIPRLRKRDTYDNETKKKMVEQGEKNKTDKQKVIEAAKKMISESNMPRSHFVTDSENARTILWKATSLDKIYSIPTTRRNWLNEAIKKGKI